MQKLQIAAAILLGALLLGCATPPTGSAPAPSAPVGAGAPAAQIAAVCPAPSVCPSCPVCPSLALPTAPPPFSRSFLAATWNELPGWSDDDVTQAWPAFLQSCRGMASRPHGAAWKRVCDLARGENGKSDGKSAAQVRRFFEQHLKPHALANGEGSVTGLVTGYYEPLLRGSRAKARGFEQPVRGVPEDLLTIDLSAVFPELKDKRVRGRLEGNKVVPYWSRAEISARGDNLPGKVLLHVDDPVELFFLQVQGSGRVNLPDGSQVRLNYADQNGHPYQSIGRVLVDRGELKLEEASMQGIQAWARANPKRLDDLLNSNPSYVFFREVPNSKEGPQGALGVPLTPERSIATDPRSIPLGAPVFLATTQPNSAQPLNRLVMAQDTGGAIKGAVRADFFWGFGKEAGERAGRMKQQGRMWLLWPADSAPK